MEEPKVIFVCISHYVTRKINLQQTQLFNITDAGAQK
jgi:hypothetical protein